MRYILIYLGASVLLLIIGLLAIFLVTRTELFPYNSKADAAYFTSPRSAEVQVVDQAHHLTASNAN